jgi:hypothetical protein
MGAPECDRYWAKLMANAQVILTGASDAALAVQLFDVLEEFFTDSNCWLEAIKFTVIPDTLEYQLIPLTGRIVRLNGVVDENNVPQQAAMPTVGTVRFLYPYTNVQPMTAVVVKNVTDPLSCSPPHIPEWVLPAYGHGILRGVLGHMMLRPAQSFSNQALAVMHLRKFRDVIAHARVATMRANTVGAQAWAFPQQFRVTGQRGGVSTANVHPATLR